MPTLSDFIRRSEELLQLAKETVATKTTSQWGDTWVDRTKFSELRASTLSFVANVYGQEHPYFIDVDKKCDKNEGQKAEALRGILVAITNELKGGWLTTARGLVSAEIFSDFLEMAEHLVKENFKDAAAVITGSVLEEHLRQLCVKHTILVSLMKGTNIVSKKADQLNADLAGAGAYNLLDQKNVTAWLDLRNKAAHGKYAEYNLQQVANMHRAVSEFMARHAV